MQIPDDSIVFGDPAEWLNFQNTHPKFFENLPALDSTMKRVLLRDVEVDSTAKELVFYSGSLVFEDFMEVLLLCGNGYGVGALKILRGQYERTVTAAYLAKHPDQAERFVKFGHIQYRRMLNQAVDLYGKDLLAKAVSPGKIAEIEKAYEESKNEFQEPLCVTCGTARTAFSWSRLDTASMAREGGYGLKDCYLHAYTFPTQLAHASVMSLLSRLIVIDGKKHFNGDAQRLQAASALSTAHVVMLKMLRIQNDFFSLGLQEEIRQREIECKGSWPGLGMDCGKDF